MSLKKQLLVIAIIIIFFIVFSFFAARFMTSQKLSDVSSSVSPSSLPAPSVGPEIFGQATPTPNIIPKTNPFKGSLNPFLDAYKNPFN